MATVKEPSTFRKFLLACLFFFVLGWALQFFFPLEKLPFKLKSLTRHQLKERLGLPKEGPLAIRVLKKQDLYGLRLMQIEFQGRSLKTAAYLLIPEAKGAFPTVLCLHGHHSTKEEVVGLKSSRFGVDFGLKLARMGFVILAPDIPYSKDLRKEDFFSLKLIMAGGSLTGLRLSLLQAMLDYISQQPFVDPERIGCAGWSMGGGLCLYLSAIDRRVKATAISCYFGTFKDTFMKRRQSTDNYIPGILQVGEMHDIACLIAPRPLWIEGVENDPEFPKESFLKAVGELQRCYKGHEDRLHWHLIPGGHRFGGDGIDRWFERWLLTEGIQ